MRTLLRTVVAGFLVGALGLDSARAGAVLTAPAGVPAPGAAAVDDVQAALEAARWPTTRSAPCCLPTTTIGEGEDV